MMGGRPTTTTTTVKAVAMIISSGGGERKRYELEEDHNTYNNNKLIGTLHFIHHHPSIPDIYGRGGGESRTEIRGKIRGLRPGCLHALHIHSFGDTSNGCLSTGPHFNPHNKDHGSPTDLDRHAGDLGNIVAGPDGVAEVTITDTQISLSGQHSILGRAVVVHANPDDLGKGGHELSKTTGNAGARIGCGIIGLQSVVYGAARI